jgi:hypothetical protein
MAAGQGADVDNPAPLESELFDRFLNGQDRPKHIGGEFAIELGNGYVLEGFKFEDTGVVCQCVELAKCRLGLREEPFHVFRIGDAALDGDGVAASVGDFGEDAIGAFLA